MFNQIFQKSSVAVAALAALAWLPSPAQAQSQFTLSVSPVTAKPGDTDVQLFGVLSNLTSAPLTYVTDDFTLLTGPSGADLTSAIFFSSDNYLDPNAPQPPMTLGANSTTPAAPLFLLDTDPSAPVGAYTGNFSVTYGGRPVGKDFTITLTQAPAVPEAGTLPILALGVGYLLFAAYRRRPASQR